MHNDSINMHEVWFYYPHNCKVWKVTNTSEYLNLPTVAVNPDLRELRSKKIKPHHWKIVNSMVLEKSDEEKLETDAWHNSHVQDNPKVITVEKEIIRTVLREIPVEVSVDREIIKYKIPLWIHIIYGGITGFITIILLK